MRQLANHWIQRADFSHADCGVADQSEILEFFNRHNWSEELQAQSDKDSRGEAACPPGLGLNAENGDVFHLCAVASDEWIVHFHHTLVYKVIGLFPSTREHVETYEGVSTAEVEQMIGQFFRGDQVSPQ